MAISSASLKWAKAAWGTRGESGGSCTRMYQDLVVEIRHDLTSRLKLCMCRMAAARRTVRELLEASIKVNKPFLEVSLPCTRPILAIPPRIYSAVLSRFVGQCSLGQSTGARSKQEGNRA